MVRPEAVHGGVAFDLASLDRELRSTPTYQQNGHMGRTLVRTDDLRVVLEVMKADSRIAEHRANETASIHVLRGAIRLGLPTRTVELRSGHLLVLEAGLHHHVDAIEESAFLLTLGWPATTEHEK